ncbi:hypothetical protein ACFZCU_45960 [Streptomyces canus]|uniref:hypothetical protein n=1 Tax=Streptomyces canus TaxID=58343 RepID=UPI0036E43813
MTPAIATLWNTAYPTMRTLAGTRITHYRRQLQDRAWDIDPTQPNADLLAAHTPTEKQLRRSLKDIENLRRTLHQLDNGTHRPCTRSPGSFSTLAAYSAVRCLLATTSLNTHGLAPVYELAAALADAAEERHRELMARTA